MLNTWILQREAPGGPRPRPLNHLDFHLAVALSLIHNFSSRKRDSTLDVEVERPTMKKPTIHEPTKIQTARGLRNCVVCSKTPRRTPSGHKIQSSFECVKCGVALCKDYGCFGQFHSYEN